MFRWSSLGITFCALPLVLALGTTETSPTFSLQITTDMLWVPPEPPEPLGLSSAGSLRLSPQERWASARGPKWRRERAEVPAGGRKRLQGRAAPLPVPRASFPPEAALCGPRWRRGCTWSITWTVRAAGAGPGPGPLLSRPGDTDGPSGGGRALPGPPAGSPGCRVPVPGPCREAPSWGKARLQLLREPWHRGPRLVCPVRKEPRAAPAASRERELGCQWFPGIDVEPEITLGSVGRWLW